MLQFSRKFTGATARASGGGRIAVAVSLYWLPAAFNCSPAWARNRAMYRYCDPQTGDAVRPDIQALNRLKNREAAPTAKDIDPTVSLAAMLRPGDDRSRRNDHKVAQVVGYVANVKMGVSKR